MRLKIEKPWSSLVKGSNGVPDNFPVGQKDRLFHKI